MKLTKSYLKQVINESLRDLREQPEEIPLPGADAGSAPELGSKRVRDVEQARTQTHDIALGKTARNVEQAKEDFNDLIGGVLQGTGGMQSKGLLALPPQTLMAMFKHLLIGDPVSGTP